MYTPHITAKHAWCIEHIYSFNVAVAITHITPTGVDGNSPPQPTRCSIHGDEAATKEVEWANQKLIRLFLFNPVCRTKCPLARHLKLSAMHQSECVCICKHLKENRLLYECVCVCMQRSTCTGPGAQVHVHMTFKHNCSFWLIRPEETFYTSHLHLK